MRERRALRRLRCRHARAELEREREEKAALAAECERARIARELHDVVAHSVSVMVVQAQAAHGVLGDARPRRASALESIEATGRESARRAAPPARRPAPATSEPRARARSRASPQLDALVDAGARRRAAGRRSRRGRGRVRSRPGVDLSAYRIVQEALTNALKHAGRPQATVVVRYAPDELELEVRRRRRGAARPPAATGHGLVGMRERVALYGGALEAGAGTRRRLTRARAAAAARTAP